MTGLPDDLKLLLVFFQLVKYSVKTFVFENMVKIFWALSMILKVQLLVLAYNDSDQFRRKNSLHVVALKSRQYVAMKDQAVLHENSGIT